MSPHSSKRIILTGGGTAGHVMPNLALINELRKRGWQIDYIGSSGMERALVENAGLPFHSIAVGKLRRYLSVQNVLDVFRLMLGVVQAWFVLRRLKPQVVFSKGGFVSVPVTFAAWFRGIPVLTHESDVSPGLANRLIGKVATKTLYCFPETKAYLPEGAKLVGTPIRKELFNGDLRRGLSMCGFLADDPRPVVMVMGGSQGAERINAAIREAGDELFNEFRIIHLTGSGKVGLAERDGYKSFEFVGSELSDLLACTDLVLSRSGANAIFEFLVTNKPMLLVPLVIGSRGDQVLNAESFVKSGFAHRLDEALINQQSLLQGLRNLRSEAEVIRKAQRKYIGQDAVKSIIETIESAVLHQN